MKKQAIIFFLAVLPGFFASSCTSANKEQLIPAGCKTDNMSYTIDIVPILQGNCYGCHGNGNDAGSGGINLADTTTLNKYINDGQLLANITHTSSKPMPPSPAPKLDTCDISKIHNWIIQGAPKN
jgi:hypothetical protein